jgi:hypothetical protein
MNHRHIANWLTLEGASVEIRELGRVVCSGIVHAVTEDGNILSVLSPVEGRPLFEKAGSYQPWAREERTGFRYKVSPNSTEPAPTRSAAA